MPWAWVRSICFVFTYVITMSCSVEPRSFIVVLIVDKIHSCYYYYYYLLLHLESATPHFNHPYGYWCVGSMVPAWVHQTMVVGLEEVSNGQVQPLKVSAKLGDWPLNSANTLRGTDTSARTFFPSCPHTPSYLHPHCQYPRRWCPRPRHCLQRAHSPSQSTISFLSLLHYFDCN